MILKRGSMRLVEICVPNAAGQKFLSRRLSSLDGQILMWENRYYKTQIVTQNMHIILIQYVEAEKLIKATMPRDFVFNFSFIQQTNADC